MPLVDFHYAAILLAAGTAFGLGALWYSPLLFGDAWVRAQGYQQDQLRRLQRQAGRAYVVSFLCLVTLALVMSVLLSLAGFFTWRQGILLGFLLWLGLAATLGLLHHVYSDRSIAAWLLDTTYHLLALLIMGAILGGWS